MQQTLFIQQKIQYHNTFKIKLTKSHKQLLAIIILLLIIYITL